jgi:hypothetical protein
MKTSLMFIRCIIRCIRKDQQYALICTNPVFYALAPTCFGTSLPSSGSFLDPPELLEIQIEWVVYHITCGNVTFVPDCRTEILKYCNCFLKYKLCCYYYIGGQLKNAVGRSDCVLSKCMKSMLEMIEKEAVVA